MEFVAYDDILPNDFFCDRMSSERFFRNRNFERLDVSEDRRTSGICGLSLLVLHNGCICSLTQFVSSNSGIRTALQSSLEADSDRSLARSGRTTRGLCDVRQRQIFFVHVTSSIYFKFQN